MSVVSTAGNDSEDKPKKLKFKLYPEPEQGKPYGPSPKQRLLFIEDLPINPEPGEEFFKRPHLHPTDVVLYIGGARCHGINTPILMYDGTIKMVQDIVVGDQLMGPDSKPRNVLSLARGREEMFKVIPKHGINEDHPFIVNKNHILNLVTSAYPLGKSKYSTGEVMNVSVEECLLLTKTQQRQLKLRKSECIHFNPQKESLKLDPYFLGAWSGDGTTLQPTITTIDKEIHDYLLEYGISHNLRLGVQNASTGKAKHIRLSSHENKGCKNYNPILIKIREENLIGYKHIPKHYLLSSEQNRLQLLAGIIDTGGTLDNDSSYVIYQKNEELAKQILFLANSLGFGTSYRIIKVNYTDPKGEKHLLYYPRIVVYGDITRIPIKITRKKSKIDYRRRANLLVRGFTIEEIGVDDYYGFELDDDHLYLTGDFTIHHNSGKTLSTVARTIKFLLDNPGSTAIVGAENRPLLWRSVVKVWQERFTYKTPWDHLKLKNRLITRKPTMNNPSIEFTNGSIVYFLHFSDPEILKGIDADFCQYEEADLIKDEDTFEELVARLSGKKGPVRQLILTTNPVKANSGWIRDKFKLWQLKADYKGEIEPIISPCSCQLCQPCFNAKLGEWVFHDNDGKPSVLRGATCSNPNCFKLESLRRFGGDQPLIREIKDNDCPGEQVFYRVIQTSSVDNIHIPSDYAQSATRGMSDDVAAAMVRGEIKDNEEGLVYSAFSDQNVLKAPAGLDLSKDLIWSLDFNYDPQCSVVAQEVETPNGFCVNIIDEIVRWNSLPEHVAKVFCQKFHAFKFTGQSVLVYSDPSGLWGSGKDLKPTFYQTIIDILKRKTNEFGEFDEDGAAFKVHMMMKRDAEHKGQLKIPVAGRVDATNALIKNADGEIRLFINPHCKYLIASLEGLKWNDDGTTINTRCDIYARRKSKQIVRSMSHPSDSLGYYIYKRFPLLRDKKGFSIFQIPGQSSVVYKHGKVVEQTIRTDQKADEIRSKRREEKRQKRKDRQEKRDNKNSKSIDSIINYYGNNGFNNFLF